LRDRLTETDRECGVFVSAGPEGLVDKDVPGHIADAVQDREVGYALVTQTLHEAIARARGRHTDSSKTQVSH
jgi:hypothetical protein